MKVIIDKALAEGEGDGEGEGEGEKGEKGEGGGIRADGLEEDEDITPNRGEISVYISRVLHYYNLAFHKLFVKEVCICFDYVISNVC